MKLKSISKYSIRCDNDSYLCCLICTASNCIPIRSTSKTKIKYMKKLIFFFSIATLLIFTSTSCKNSVPDSVTSKSYEVSSFSKLDIEIIGEVIYLQSDSVYVSAKGSSSLTDALKVSEKKGELSIEMKNKRKFSGSKKELVITVGSPNIEEINFESIGNLHLKNNIKVGNLKITNKGVGEIKIDDCHVNKFDLISKSVGTIKIKGSANESSIHSENIGQIDCSKFKAKKAKVVSKGTSDLLVYANESIDITISGIGKIKYYGNPQDVKTDISRLGKATNMGD